MAAVSDTDISNEQEVLEMIRLKSAGEFARFIINLRWGKLKNKIEVFDLLHQNKMFVKLVKIYISDQAAYVRNNNPSDSVQLSFLEMVNSTLLSDHPDIGHKDLWTRPYCH